MSLFVKVSKSDDGFCSAPSITESDEKPKPIYWKVTNPTLSHTSKVRNVFLYNDHLPGYTRSVYKRNYALITPESHVYSPLPDWTNTLGAYLITPAMGSHFVIYFAKMKVKLDSFSVCQHIWSFATATNDDAGDGTITPLLLKRVSLSDEKLVTFGFSCQSCSTDQTYGFSTALVIYRIKLQGPAILGEVISIVQFVFVIVGESLGGHIRTHMNSLANSCSHQSRTYKGSELKSDVPAEGRNGHDRAVEPTPQHSSLPEDRRSRSGAAEGDVWLSRGAKGNRENGWNPETAPSDHHDHDAAGS
ncbi:hypothetical protein Bca52824_040905 [Brassica carinata]|uniref:Uncharacterized protein n=1 Tax=Brassica carinata TaxID=52824 RepID=A0A8X7RU34_BRACI|nr:hypothetical protein Bca52824_040905 [Brassica carinata]